MSTNKNYRCERIVGYVGKKNITTDVPGTYKQTSIMARLMVWSAYSNKFPVSIKDCVTFVDYASSVAGNLGVVDTILPSRRNYEFNDFDLDITKDEVSATMFDSVEDKITTDRMITVKMRSLMMAVVRLQLRRLAHGITMVISSHSLMSQKLSQIR